jgi:hypothetical protein
MAHHPLPWSLDLDWGVDLRDAKKTLIATFMCADEAQFLIDLAEDMKLQNEKIEEGFSDV